MTLVGVYIYERLWLQSKDDCDTYCSQRWLHSDGALCGCMHSSFVSTVFSSAAIVLGGYSVRLQAVTVSDCVQRNVTSHNYPFAMLVKVAGTG